MIKKMMFIGNKQSLKSFPQRIPIRHPKENVRLPSNFILEFPLWVFFAFGTVQTRLLSPLKFQLTCDVYFSMNHFHRPTIVQRNAIRENSPRTNDEIDFKGLRAVFARKLYYVGFYGPLDGPRPQFNNRHMSYSL